MSDLSYVGSDTVVFYQRKYDFRNFNKNTVGFDKASEKNSLKGMCNCKYRFVIQLHF